MYRFIVSNCSSLLFSHYFLCLAILSIVESGMLNSPTVTVLMSISPFRYANVSFIYLSALIMGAHILVGTIYQGLQVDC